MKILEDECSIIENTSDIIVIKYDDRLLTNELALSYKTALLCKERPTSELATVCLSSATSRHCVRMSVKAVNDFVCRRVQQLYHRLYRCCFFAIVYGRTHVVLFLSTDGTLHISAHVAPSMSGCTDLHF